MARPKGSKNKTSKAAPAKSSPSKAAAPVENVKGSEVDGMITKSALAAILKTEKRTKEQQALLTEEVGIKIADAIRKFGTNRKALATIRMLNRMEPEAQSDYLDHLDYMLDISGIEERAAAVHRLPMGDAPGEEAADDGGAEDTANNAATESDDNVSRPAFGRAAATVA